MTWSSRRCHDDTHRDRWDENIVRVAVVAATRDRSRDNSTTARVPISSTNRGSERSDVAVWRQFRGTEGGRHHARGDEVWPGRADPPAGSAARQDGWTVVTCSGPSAGNYQVTTALRSTRRDGRFRTPLSTMFERRMTVWTASPCLVNRWFPVRVRASAPYRRRSGACWDHRDTPPGVALVTNM